MIKSFPTIITTMSILCKFSTLGRSIVGASSSSSSSYSRSLAAFVRSPSTWNHKYKDECQIATMSGHYNSNIDDGITMKTSKSTLSLRMLSSDSESSSSWYDESRDEYDKFDARTRRSESPKGEKQRRRRNDRRRRDYNDRMESRRDGGGAGRGDGDQTFRDNFRGTRVFVQGIPDWANWQELKDHFKIAGDVVFASVSMDTRTGISKGCGIVQYETTEMAANAIKIMRDHPMEDSVLFVRQDYQEGNNGPNPTDDPYAGGGGRGRDQITDYNSPSSPPKNSRLGNVWRCADEENASHLPAELRSSIESIVSARDQARRRKNYEVSDRLREELKSKYRVHLDDRLKSWWYAADDVVPREIGEGKGEGRWNLKAWRMIPTTPENDACVNQELVNGLLKQRDVARREKDFGTADFLLEEARTCPDGELNLRIHDESRTWRVWTEAPPPRPLREVLSAGEQCVRLVEEHDPNKVGEIRSLLSKFPGREYNILKRLKQQYEV